MANQTTKKAIWDKSGFTIFKQWLQKPWGVLLVLALALYFGSLGYQAGEPARDARYLAWATAQLPDTPENLTLAIAYPRIVPLEAPDKPGWPLSVYLWPPVLPITPAVTGMPPSATPAPIATAPARMSLPVTPTLTPTPTQAMSYTVAFLPYDDGLLFTDKDGVPVAPQVMVNPGEYPGKPAVLYVRRAPMDIMPVSVPITVQVYGLDETPDDLTTLNVELEDEYHAWWRHFWDLVFGPTTPLLALAATLVGFGWQWWQEGQKRKWELEQEVRRRREERLAEIEQVRALTLQNKLREAVEKLLEVSHKVEHIWAKDPELVARLTEVREELEGRKWCQKLYQQSLQYLEEKPEQAEEVAQTILKLDPGFSPATDLQYTAGMLRAFQEGQDKWLDKVEDLGIDTAIATLVRISRDCGRSLQSVLAELLADLTGRAKYVEVSSQHLKRDWAGLYLLRQSPFEERLRQLAKDSAVSQEARATARELLDICQRPFVRPDLWPSERPPETPAVSAWLKESGSDLRFNPFGPERAEDDPLLPQLFVEPPGWESMKALEPTVVFGANGSGRTASRLLLAHTCTTTKLGPDRTGGQVDTFPVRLALFPEGKLDEAIVTCWKMLTRALAQATLEFLALNPQTFAETPFCQQRALARLFSLHRHYLGDMTGYLESAGLDRATAVHLASNIRRAGRGTRPPVLADEAELSATLAEARLSPFQQCYVLVEVPNEVSTRLSPEEIAPHLSLLLQMMRPLAVRGVYFKLFIPMNLKHLLETLPPQINEVELLWEAPALRQILEWRVQQAGSASFRALFRRLPQDIDPAALLVQEALKSEGPPRWLIQLGQKLLAEHIRRAPGDPRLDWEELKAVLGKSAQGVVA